GNLLVQLLAAGSPDADDLRERAGHIVRAHLDAPAEIEVDTGPSRAPAVGERVELLAVLPSPDGREIEVHLAYGGQRTVGRGQISGGASEAVGATLDGLRALRLAVPFAVVSAAAGLQPPAGSGVESVVVALESVPPG